MNTGRNKILRLPLLANKLTIKAIDWLPTSLYIAAKQCFH